MVDVERWTIAERYMVRYHLTHLVWWALGSIGLLIIASIAVLAYTSVQSQPLHAMAKTLWHVTFVATPVLTGVSFLVKEHLLGRVYSDWELHKVLLHYKRTVGFAVLLCLAAGLIPVCVAAFAGHMSYGLLLTLVPLAALILHFPYQEKFYSLVDQLARVHQ